MDRATPNNTSILNEAVWTVDLSGQSEAVLSFSHASFGDERHAFPVPFQPFIGQFRADGIAISNDGETWFPAFRAPLQTDSGQWIDYSVDLAAAADAGLTLDDPDFHVKFQQYDNLPIPVDGRGWDDISIEMPSGDVDSFTVDVDPGQTISVIVDGDDSLRPEVELLLVEPAPGRGNPNRPDRQVPLAAAQASEKGGSAVIQTVRTLDNPSVNFSGPHTYLVRVSGAGETFGSYETRIVLNALVEEESTVGGSNGSRADAEDLEPSVIGLNQGPFGYSVGEPGAGKPGRAAALGTLESPTATVPEVFEDVEPFAGNRFPFIINPNFQTMRYQQIYASDEFSEGGLIDEIRFRRTLNSPPFTGVTLDLEIKIGYAAMTVTTASPVFDDNIGDEFQTVFDGVLTLDSEGLSPGADAPPPFDFVFDVADAFRYDPARGDLLVEFLVRDSASTFTRFFSAAPGGVHEGTTRIVRGGDFDAVDGIVGFTQVNPRPYGLVTQFAFAEQDFYQLDLKRGETATFTANALSGGDVNLELLDEAANVVAAGLSVGEELVVNGSFETGDFSG